MVFVYGLYIMMDNRFLWLEFLFIGVNIEEDWFNIGDFSFIFFVNDRVNGVYVYFVKI